MTDDWLADLDEAQLAAAEHDAGPLIVAAGAGTGKTRTLTARVARLLEAGVPAERILLLTFTRRAAAAMTTRAAAACADSSAAQRMCSGTFHAVAHRIIAEHVQHLGLAEVTVLDPNDVVDLLDLMREEHGLVGTQRRMPTSQALADVYSRATNTGRRTREVMAEQFPWCIDHADEINALLRDYVARKRARGLLDFDDLLLYWRALLSDEGTGARLRARWDWVLVDEYQDVNRIQVDIVRQLRPDGIGLTVVGDDAQAVYGFRGASAEHLLELHRQLPGATLIRLERNFRSTQPVLDLANIVRPGELRLQLTAHRTQRGARPVLVNCANADDEARRIADAVLADHQDGVALRDQVVLMRAGSHSNQLEIELKVRNVPFVKYGGIEYVNTAHVRDLMAAFRVVTNPADEVAWYRLLARHRAIGKAIARTLSTMLVSTNPDAYPEVVAAAPAKARAGLQSTLALLGQSQTERQPSRVVELCHEAVRPLVRAHYADWPRRVEDIDRLAETAAQQRDLRAFVADLTIDPAGASADYAQKPSLDEDYLTLSTVHSAKGLEWRAVHVLRAVDGAFPSDMALTSDDGLAEEQRLFYVAITRARDTLRIYTPTRLPTHPTSFTARHVITKPSRFLSEPAREVMDIEEIPAAATVSPAPMAAPAAPTRVVVPTLDDLFA
ncbi:MAG TPA: ATP-dependent helicase [Jatrophihabitans sp.]|jgi:DNA helicase-2/ATP-dependent DNA helicase PcrA